uniref:Uncharacterized protein n=1 Tax=Panagrolaimus sp. ES5 TaxID=591445 RepID=A0AC34G347_9BILA
MTSKTRDLIALVDYQDGITVVNTTNGEQATLDMEEVYGGEISSAKELCAVLEQVMRLDRIKAILFIVVSTNFRTFNESNQFRLLCREFCQKHDIFFVSVPFTTLEAIFATSETQTMVTEGEQVLIAFSIMPGHPSGITLLREKNRYRILKYNRSQYFMFTDEWKEEFLGMYDHKKFVLVHNSTDDEDRKEEIAMYEDFFEEYNAASLTQGPERELLSKAVVEKVLHLMGEKISPYDVAPPCLNEFFVNIGTKSIMEALIYADALPLEKSVIVDLYVRIDSLGRKELLKEIKLSTFMSKQVKITLKIDVNALYEFHVDPVGENDLGEKLAEVKIGEEMKDSDSAELKGRIVFGKQNFAIFVKEAGSGFRMIEGADGLDGTPIYIAFTGEKPIVGHAAKELYNTKPEYVVFDLVKLCSITSADLMSQKWGFSVSKDDNTIMVTMQTPDGEMKSSVALLLAIIIRHALKVIKNETGKKLNKTEIEFCSFAPNDVLKQTFIDAGKFMGIEIEFC